MLNLTDENVCYQNFNFLHLVRLTLQTTLIKQLNNEIILKARKDKNLTETKKNKQ